MVGVKIDLGIAWRFAILAGTSLTDTPVGSHIIGNVAVHPGASVPAGMRITGDVYIATAAALAVKTQVIQAVAQIAGLQRCITNLGPAVELGGRTLKQGIYDGTVMTSECPHAPPSPRALVCVNVCSKERMQLV